MFTYRDQRLAGWQFVTGLIRFQVICAVGAISNVGIATRDLCAMIRTGGSPGSAAR